MSGDVEVAYSAGRRKGTSAPYARAISAMSSAVRREHDALEHAALPGGLDRVCEQRMPRERPHVLPRHPLGAGPRRHEGDGARPVLV